MASYLSQKIETLPPSSSVNVELIAQVQGAKQGQYNLAKTQINQTLDAFENLKVLRPQDQEYIQAKLTDLKSKLDASTYKDLSDINLSDSLMSQIKTAAKDPFIVDAMANTAKFTNFQQQLANMKEKKPELYNDANYSYAIWKGGVQEYLEGKSNGIGNLNYTPYTDLSEEHLKKLKNIKELKGKRFIETPDGQGGIVRKEIDGLTENEIRSYFGSILTSQELEQMKINGWAKYGQNPQQAQQLVSGYYNENIKQIDDRLEEAQAKLKLNLSQSEKEQVESAIEGLKEEKQSYTDRLSSIDKIPVDMLSLELEKSSYLNGLSEIAKSEWNVEYKADDVYWKQRDMEVKMEELQMKREKHALELAKLQKETGLNADGSVNADVSVSSREATTDEVTTLETSHNELYNEILLTAKQLTAENTPEAEYFKARLKAYGLNTNMQWIDPVKNKNNSIASTIEKILSDDKLKEEFPDVYMKVSKANRERNAIARDIITVEKDAYLETFNKNSDKYVNGLKKMSDDLQTYAKYETLPGIGGVPVNLQSKNEALAVNTLIESFVKEAGGWNNLDSYLKSNPNKLRTFAKLTKQADETFKGVLPTIKTVLTQANPLFGAIGVSNKRSIFSFSDVNLEEDAKETVQKKMSDYSKSGKVSTFTAHNAITIGNPTVSSDIVKTITSEQYINSDANFDLKDLPSITVYKGTRPTPEGNGVISGIWIEQFQGSMGSGKNQKNKYARAFIEKGDAAYAKISEIVDIEQEKARGYDVTDPNITFRTSTPKKYSLSDRGGFEKSAERANAISLVNSYNSSLGGVVATVPTPANYIDDHEIKKTYSQILNNVYGVEKTKEFTNYITSELPNFEVTPVTEKQWVNGNKIPQLSVKIVNRNIKSGNNRSFEISIPTGASIVDDKLIYMIDTFPQIFIADAIMRKIQTEKPTELREIFN